MENVFIDFTIKFGLEKVWKWKWWIGALVSASSLGAFLWASQMAPEFESRAAFIPPSINSLYSLTYNQGIAYRGFEAAEEEDIDRVVDYLTSIQVMDSLARQFKLYEHYGIVWGTPNADKMFYNSFKGKNSVSFSSRSVVQIECYDTDPKIAEAIAAQYLAFAEDFFDDLSGRKRGLAECQRQVDSLRHQRQVVLDSLSYMRDRFKLFHIDNAGDALSAILANQLRSDPGFAKLYDRMYSMELQLNVIEERIGEIESELGSRLQYVRQFPQLIKVTQQPRESTFKARPKRSIYMIFAGIAALVTGALLVVALDRKNDRLPV